MKKRLMSFVLMLSLLLSMFTAFATTASAADEGSDGTAASTTASYVDLYVKDGLLALFDGFSVTASATTPTKWTPADLYGKEGYDSYIDPSRYTYAFTVTGTTASLKQVDAGYQMVINGTLAWNDAAYLNLDTLGALLGTDGIITLQEVTSHTTMAPTLENNVVTNYSTLDKNLTNYRGGRAYLGSYSFGGSQLTGANLDGYSKIVGCVTEQLGFGSKYLGHLTYSTAAYGAVTYPTLTGDDGTDLSGYTVGGPVTVERTVSRFPYTEQMKRDADGNLYTEYTSKYTFSYIDAPVARKHSSAIATTDGFTYASADEALHTATKLHVAADGALTRSIRLYNRELTAAELSANHLADLAGFYQLDSKVVEKILSLDAKDLRVLYNTTDAIKITATGRDTTAGSDYMQAKVELLQALGYTQSEDGETVADYSSLYVKDGLVALFDAYSLTASSAAVTQWKPVSLAGVSGYDDYIDLSDYTYSFVGTWNAIDGGLNAQNSGTPYLNLDSLGARLGTNYTVQEVLSYQLMTPVITNGVLMNNSSYVSYGAYNVNAVGPLRYSWLNTPNIAINLTGYSTPLHNVLFGQVCFNQGGTTDKYKSHVYFTTAAYGAVKYDTLTDSSGTSYAGYTIGGGNTVIEQSIARLGVTETTSSDSTVYTSAYKIHFQFAPYIRYTGEATDVSYSFGGDFSTDRNVHYSTALRLGTKGVTYHSIRIYNRELSKSEYNLNHLVDLAAYSGASLSDYAALSAEMKVLVANAMAGYKLTTDKESVAEALSKAIEEAIAAIGVSNSLYVTDGLTVLLSAYEGLATPYTASGSTVLWSNAIDGATYGTLKGTGWKRNASGGFTIVKTIDDYNGTRPENVPIGGYAFYTPKEQYGLEFDGSLLPEADYTVELVANPVGITNKDGTRWLDSYSKYGTYIENGFAIGPLRALQFGAYHVSGGNTRLGRRWNYGVGDTPYNDFGGKGLFQESYWCGLDQDAVVTLTISMDVTDTHNSYVIEDGSLVTNYVRDAAELITNAEANNMFRLMNGVAGTIYAVRVYDRVLTAEEKAQNHMADLVYYYGVDAGLIGEFVHAANLSIASLTDAFSDIDFTLDKSEAQEIITRRLIAIFMTESGYAVRGDLTDGLRYYFDIHEAAINVALSAGYTVEAGTVVNVGKNAAPVLYGNGYDYKIVAYDSVMGKEDVLFVDDNTYAVTVRYENADKATLNTAVKAVGYVKLTDAYGNETVYYTEGKTPNNLFEGYYLTDKAENPAIEEDDRLSAFVTNRIASAYEDFYIHLDKNAASGGNGTASTPYNDFATAFAAAKKFLRGLTTPTNLYITIKDGRYSITETQQMLDADKPYEYSTFTVTSESGNAVLTTTVDIDASKFVLEGDNIYSYQFARDASGNYPAFRTLYVNDALAEIATSGSSRAANRENLYVTAVDRTTSGVEYNARKLRSQSGFGFSTTYAPYAGRADLMEEFAYYRDKYVAYNDVLAISTANAANLVYGMTPTQSSASEAYKEGFHQFVIQFMAAYDVRQMIASNGWTGNNLWKPTVQKTVADFGNNATDFATYSDAFIEVRNAMATAQSATMVYTDFEAFLREDQRHIGRMYMPEGMVGDLTSLIEPGKAYMKEYAASLLATASTTADLKTAQDLSAAVNDEYLWRRHCLTPYKIELHHTCQWNYNIVHLSGIDYTDYIEVTNAAGVTEKHVAIYMYMKEYSVFQINAGYSTADRYVHMKNAYQYLDENNEYYYDEEAGKLYYYSDTAVSGKDFEYATLDNMFIIRDVENLVFDNVQFTGTDDYCLTQNGYMGGLSGMQPAYYGIWGVQNAFQDRSALYLMNCSDVTVKDCRFYDLPCEAVDVVGWSVNYTIENNSFENIGSSALRMGIHKPGREDGYGTSWYEGFAGNRNVKVENNYFGNIATEYYVPALMITKIDNGSIRYNTITDCSYTAMSIGWDWGVNYDVFDHDLKVNVRNVDISYNYITNFMTEMGDGGAIYTPVWNGPVDNTDFYVNSVHHNTIILSKTSGDGMGKMLVGIYFDASSSNWYCNENVIAEQSYGAVSTETDYSSYGTTAAEAALKQKRRNGSHCIYLQYIDDQETHNIFVDGNYILNVRGTTESAQFSETYRNSFNQKDPPSRNLQESGTQYIVGVRNLPQAVKDIIASSGSVGHKGDVALIQSNNY